MKEQGEDDVCLLKESFQKDLSAQLRRQSQSFLFAEESSRYLYFYHGLALHESKRISVGTVFTYRGDPFTVIKCVNQFILL